MEGTREGGAPRDPVRGPTKQGWAGGGGRVRGMPGTGLEETPGEEEREFSGRGAGSGGSKEATAVKGRPGSKRGCVRKAPSGSRGVRLGGQGGGGRPAGVGGFRSLAGVLRAGIS